MLYLKRIAEGFRCGTGGCDCRAPDPFQFIQPVDGDDVACAEDILSGMNTSARQKLSVGGRAAATLMLVGYDRFTGGRYQFDRAQVSKGVAGRIHWWDLPGIFSAGFNSSSPKLFLRAPRREGAERR